jgi:hypothetical protein
LREEARERKNERESMRKDIWERGSMTDDDEKDRMG